MKPAPFAYQRPSSLEQALELLAANEDAKVLAGGQSLVPMLNMRLARPELLIDLGAIHELAYIRKSEGQLRIGAMTRQAAVLESQIVEVGWPLLHEAVSWVAHSQIRNLGTIGGSIAHADPAAELPVACVVFDAKLRARSVRGVRDIEARDLFVTHLTTSLEPDEILTEVEFGPQPAGWGFVEFARRSGDFALGGAAALLETNGDGAIARTALTLMTAAPVPLRASEAEHFLTGTEPSKKNLAEAARLAAQATNPTGDIHGSTEYRRALVQTMARRTLEMASERAHAA